MQSTKVKLKKLFSVVATASLLIFSSNVATASIPADTVVEILKLSGLTAQIAQYPAHFKAGLADATDENNDISEELVSAFSTATNKTVKSSEILFEVAVSINKVMKESELQEMLVWYRSDLGKEITREEEIANTPAGQKVVRQEMRSLLDDFQRADFARSIEKLYDATSFSIQIQEQVDMASVTASTAYSNPGDAIDPEQFRPKTRADLEKQRPKLKEMIVASIIHAHRNIGLRDLIKYEMFLTSDAALKFNALTAVSVGTGLKKNMQQWTKEVQQELDQLEL